MTWIYCCDCPYKWKAVKKKLMSVNCYRKGYMSKIEIRMIKMDILWIFGLVIHFRTNKFMFFPELIDTSEHVIKIYHNKNGQLQN